MTSFKFISVLTNIDEFDREVNRVFFFLHNLEAEYNGFREWYWNKVVPAVAKGSKEIIVAEYEKKIIGVAIIKDEWDEKKICTLRVREGCRSQGIGRRLMELAFARLNTQTPLITVSSMRIAQFKRIFDYYGFIQSAYYEDYYGRGKAEICFNGCLPGTIYLPEYETDQLLQENA